MRCLADERLVCGHSHHRIQLGQPSSLSKRHTLLSLAQLVLSGKIQGTQTPLISCTDGSHHHAPSAAGLSCRFQCLQAV